MSHTDTETETDPATTAAAPERWSPRIDLSETAFYMETCRKQEEAIQALEDSAYVVRRGQRQLRDPKRLALAIRLRAKHMADFSAFTPITRDIENCGAYLRALFAGLEAECAGSPELSGRIGRLIKEVNDKYGPKKKGDDGKRT